MKKFSIQWSEEVRYNCEVTIEAKSEEEALQKWKDGDYEKHNRDEADCTVDEEPMICEL